MLRSFTRAGASFPDEGVRFALIMTITDGAGKAAIYDEMRNEIIRRGLYIADITIAIVSGREVVKDSDER